MSVKWSTKSTCGYCGLLNGQSIICERCGKMEYMRLHPMANMENVGKIKDILFDLGIQNHIEVSMQILDALDYNFPVEIAEDDRENPVSPPVRESE